MRYQPARGGIINGCVWCICLLLGIGRLSAQEINFPNYEEWLTLMGDKMLEYCKEYPCKDINAVRRTLLEDMTAAGKFPVDLPAPRKKRLDSKQIHRLCRKSSLLCGGMKINPQTGNYQAYPIASATALTADGLCATNYHVLSDVILSGLLGCQQSADFMRLVMDIDGNVFPIQEILAADPLNDFALFRVAVGERKLTPIPLGETAVEGEEVYCLSHSQGLPFYFTKGMVARNVSVTNKKNGHVRQEMQITADYGVGASGGPIIDSHGNLAGLVGSTFSMYADPKAGRNFQLTVKKAVPVKLLRACLLEPHSPRVGMQQVQPSSSVGGNHITDSVSYGIRYLWTYKSDKPWSPVYKEDRVVWVTPSVTMDMSYQPLGDWKWQEKCQKKDLPRRDPALQYTMTPSIDIYYSDEQRFKRIYRIATNDFLLQDTVEQHVWEVTNEERMVGEFFCKKAVCTIDGRKWTAWFTADLPYAAAPGKLTGLPGVLLEATDESGNIKWEFQEVIACTDKEKQLIRLPEQLSYLPPEKFSFILKMFSLSSVKQVQEAGVIKPDELYVGYPSTGVDAYLVTD